MSTPVPAQEQTLRELAISRLKKQADFRLHLVIYLMVNTFLVIIWYMSGVWFFWPVFVICGWGIGIVANWWDAYLRATPTEAAINREMHRLQDRGASV